MKISIKRIVLSALAVCIISPAAYAADLSSWAVSEYESANEAGLLSYSVVSNNMKESITRQEFCELAVNLYKRLTNDTKLIQPSVSPFSDTDSVAVSQAYCYGIVSGTDDGTFTPSRLVTREEMAKMLVSTLTASEVDFSLSDGSDTYVIDSFEDGSDVSNWAKTSVITALNYSLMNGVNGSDFAPAKATTREQAIASVNRSYEKFAKSDYSINLPVITLPTADSTIEQGPFEIDWSATSSAAKYHVLVKDSASKPIISEYTEDTKITIDADWMQKNADYSVIIGAVLSDGSECFSVPVDFTYVSKAKKPEKQYLASNPKAQEILDDAAKYLGVPYVWGGTSPSGFDCSGLMQYVFGECGISLHRVADDQLHGDGVYVSKDQLQPGDLVFFGSGDYASHVGMYVGDGMMIHAPHTGTVVQYADMNSSYYTSRFIGAKRVF